MRVADPRGNVVHKLGQDDFSVREEGRARPILYFHEEAGVAVSLALLLDIGSQMSEERILAGKEFITQLVHLLDPEDEILLGVYDHNLHLLSPLTRDRYQLLAGVENISGSGRAGFWSRLGTLYSSSGFTGGAIDHSLIEMRRASNPIKIVLIISAAFGNLGKSTYDHLESAGARLFTLGWDNKLKDSLNLWGDSVARRRLVSQTGGIAFEGSTILERISQLRDSMKSFYLLAYQPAESSKELGTRSVSIEINNHPEYETYALRRVATDASIYSQR